jgi:hypothetical protein
LIVMTTAGESEEFEFEVRQPVGLVGQQDLARFKLGRNDGHATDLVPVRPHCDDAGDLRTQLLNERGPGARVLDKNALDSKRDGERFNRRL